MKVLGFNFTKLHAEKYSENKEGITLNRNFDVSDIKEVNANMLNTSGKVLAVNFTHTLNYTPDFAKVDLAGKLLVSIDEETGKEVLEKWQNNSTPEEFQTSVLNIILKRVDLKSLQFEEELNIPFHLRLSRVQKSSNQEQKNQ